MINAQASRTAEQAADPATTCSLAPGQARLVVDIIRGTWPQAQGIYLFGSAAHGDAGPDSDLDLAVLVPGAADPLLLWDVSARLADALGQPVDLLDLRAASTVMQHQVLSRGQRLWARDPEAGLFECFALTEKLRLDEARAGLIRDIAVRGRIHG